MMLLKQVELKKYTHNLLLDTFNKYDGIQLFFKNRNDFLTSFEVFGSLLEDYSSKIKSLYCPIENVCEDTVYILSQLESKLDICINHISIRDKFHNDIIMLIDFYWEDLQDGSLTISIDLEEKTPIDIIALIERRNLLGVNISIDKLEMWITNQYLNNCVKKYIGTITCDFGFTTIEKLKLKCLLIEDYL